MVISISGDLGRKCVWGKSLVSLPQLEYNSSCQKMKICQTVKPDC